jgi:hypothetical protein
LVQNPAGKGHVGIHRYSFQENIKIDLTEMGWNDLDLSTSGSIQIVEFS